MYVRISNISQSDHFSPVTATAAAATIAPAAKINLVLFSFHAKLFIFRENIGILLTSKYERNIEIAGQNQRVYSSGKKCGLNTV